MKDLCLRCRHWNGTSCLTGCEPKLVVESKRRPDSVEFSTMEADAKRRDLTVNGMFFDVISGQLFDFVGGELDLKAKRIRFIGNPEERIEEDALRMLRAIRFATKFDATLGREDALAISDNAWRVEVLSGERIFDEMTKILRLHKPRRALTMLSDLGLLERVLPEVQALAQCLQGPPWHCEGATVQRILVLQEEIHAENQISAS